MPTGIYIRTEKGLAACRANGLKASEKKKGTKLSSETIEKIRQAAIKQHAEGRGRTFKKGEYKATEETKEKLRVAHTGKKMNDETRERMREAQSKRRSIEKINNPPKPKIKKDKKIRPTSKITHICFTCGKEYLAYIGKSKNTFCNKACHNEYVKKFPLRYWLGKKGVRLSPNTEFKKGQRSINYIDGMRASEREKISSSPEYKNWRTLVFSRDWYTCQKCKKEGGVLRAHHILNFSERKDLRFNVDNGITLCQNHHVEFHKKYGRKNNTKDQLNEYLNTEENIHRMAI